MKKVLSILVIVLIFVVGCKKDDEVDPVVQLATDKGLIQEYLTTNGITAIQTESGLSYVIDVEGTETEYPDAGSTVTIKYRGYTLDHVVFDETTGTQVYTSIITVLIDGMQEGLKLMTVGTEVRLFIPSGLAYGSGETSNVSANSCLIFELELVSFSNE